MPRNGGGGPAAWDWIEQDRWRRVAWAGVGLQVLGVAALLVHQRWPGAAVLATFAAASVAATLLGRLVPPFLAMLMVLAAVGNAGGWVWDLYQRWWWYDDLLHLATPFAVVATLLLASARLGMSRAVAPASRALLLGATMGFGIGVLWEFAEALFIELGWRDTLMDLVLDTAGGMLAAGFVSRALRPPDGSRGARGVFDLRDGPG